MTATSTISATASANKPQRQAPPKSPLAAKPLSGAETGMWAVVNTHPHKEQLALSHLARQDFVTYCPRLRQRVRKGRRFADVLKPMFPGYVFVHLSKDATRWRPILSTIGVRTLIRCGDEPALLPGGLIEGLKQRERDGAIALPESPYQEGQTVRFTGGPFDGVIATILSVRARDRLMVLMDLMQGQVKTTVSTAQVTPV